MKIRTLNRHLKESLKSIVRNGWMTFASVSAVTVTLVLVGVFYIILMNLNEVATSVEEDVSIKVLIDSTAEKAEINNLQKQIQQMKDVESVTFSSKDQELNALIADLGDDGNVFLFLKDDNPLRDAFILKAKNPEDTGAVAKQVEKLDYVYKVTYGKEYVEKLFDVIEVSRNVGLVLILGLLFTAIFLISNTIKITIVARRSEIEIMRLVGATNNFIRWPFFLEGLWLGILGSVIPIILVLFSYKELYNLIAPSLQDNFIKILPFDPFAYQTCLILLVMGSLIGIWGSVMSVRKFLKI